MTRAEILDCLTGRPCKVCKFHESGRCERWDCVFEERAEEQEDDALGMTKEELAHFINATKDKWRFTTESGKEVSAEQIIKTLSAEPCREADDYENEIADLQNRLDIAEYDKERWKEKVTVLEEKLKSLSAEPCEDCISRQAVMDAMYDLCGEESLKDNPWRDNPHIDSITDAIEHLPSVTPKQKMGRWIPVSERLPEVKYDSLGNNISDYVLLLVKKGDYETYKVGYFSPPNCFDAITSDGWFISVCALKDVIAWMPLPEPYKAESEG